MRIELQRFFFGDKERTLLEHGQFQASLFRYETGVEAVRLGNARGYIVVLPYYGQQVWEAVFDGRSIGMKTLFEQPKRKDSFLDNYGCYMMHCGALRCGCPTDEDSHALHGELPTAIYDSAAIVTGQDEDGNYIGLTGVYEYNRSFGDKYDARPLVKLYENSGVIHASIEVENCSSRDMELMYLLHVNNAAVDGGRILQTSGWSPEEMAVRTFIPPHNVVPDGFREFMDKVAGDPSLTKVMRPEDDYNPEICIEMTEYKTDGEGWAYVMQVLPDGSADMVSFNKNELPISQRWLCTTRAEGQSKLGLALPGTAGTEGYLAEKAKGRVQSIPPHGTFCTTVRCGLLNSEEAKQLETKIEGINGK